MPCAQHHVKCV